MVIKNFSGKIKKKLKIFEIKWKKFVSYIFWNVKEEKYVENQNKINFLTTFNE